MFNWFKKRKNSGKVLSNDEWVEQLTPPPAEQAVAKLRIILVRG